MKNYNSDGSVSLTLCNAVESFLGTYLGQDWDKAGMDRAVASWYGDRTIRDEKVKAGYSRDARKAGEIRTPQQASCTLIHRRSPVGEFWAWQDRVEKRLNDLAKAEADGISGTLAVVKLPEGNGFASWLESWRAKAVNHIEMKPVRKARKAKAEAVTPSEPTQQQQ